MADIAKQAFTNVGTAMTTQATAVGGDKVKFGGRRTILLFQNGHGSSITVTMAAVKSSAAQPGSGIVTVPARARVAAAGELAIFDLKPGEVDNYVDANGDIAFTYTSHNAALVVAAIDAS